MTAAALWQAAEVAAACALMPCVEITTARVRQARHIAQSPDDVLDILADNAVQGGLVVGAAIDDWRTLSLLDITIDLRIDGGQAVPLNPREDRSEPFKVMVWLVNALSARGIGLSVSQVTTLGSITVSQPLAPGQSAVADYGRFGSIAVAVAAPDEQVIPEKLP